MFLQEAPLTEGMAVYLEHARYVNEYRAPPIPKKMGLDSHYGACFRACMAHIFELLGKRGHRDRLHVVMEAGHPNVWDCDRIFRDMKSRCQRRGINLVGDFTVAEKAESQPLMAADMLASTYSMMRSAAAELGVHPAELPGVDAPVRGKAGLTFLSLQPDALRHLKENFETDRLEQIAARQAEWSAARARSGAALRRGSLS